MLIDLVSRLKQIKDAYTHEDAQADAGRWTDNGKREKNPDIMDEDVMAT